MTKQFSTASGNSICGFEGLLLRGGRVTKWKGRAASMSPHISALSAGISVSAFAVSMALGNGLLLAPVASAQEVLSGSQTTTRTLNGSPLVVTTDPTFSVVTAAGDGVVLNGTGGTILTDTNSSTITGATDGIDARNTTGGALSVTTTGAVSGTSATGIHASNSGTGTDLTISAAAVTGGTYGISVNNRGSGAISVTATGDVSGASGRGISAANTYKVTATDLTISAAAVTGGTDGINAANIGSGVLSVTATGAVSGASGSGISVANGAASTDLTISAAAVTGGTSGINAINNGRGALSVTTTGDVVSGTSGTGIGATNRSTATDLTISAAAVTGGYFGIGVTNQGSGALSVTATGAVSGTKMGLSAVNFDSTSTDLTISAAAVTGGSYGIRAFNRGSGALSVTSTGAVSGASGRGIFATNDGTDLTISAAAVTGNSEGIYARNLGSGVLSVTVSGAVSGGSRAGIATVSNAGGAVAINLLSTSSVGATRGLAISDGVGDAVVTIANGAVVTGRIELNDGNDTVNIASGADLTGVTSLNAGGGAFTDTLNIKAGTSGALSSFEVINADTAGGGFTLGGVISGSGTTLTKTGAGALLLSGTNTFTGATTVSAGTLNVTGSLASSATTVQTGGTLGGTGTVGSVTAQSGATVAPGMSIGTLGVNGNLTFDAGSTLEIEVSPTDADRINVSGTATLGGTLSLIATGGTYVADTSYTLLSAGTVTGSFGNITGFAAFGAAFDPTVTLTATDVTLKLGLRSSSPPIGPSILTIGSSILTFQDGAGNLVSSLSAYVAGGGVQLNSASVSALVDGSTITTQAVGSADGSFVNSSNTASAIADGNRFGAHSDLNVIGSSASSDGIAISTASSNTAGVTSTASDQEASSTLTGLTTGLVAVDNNSITATTTINNGSTDANALTIAGQAPVGYTNLATAPATVTLNDAVNLTSVMGTLAASNVQRSLSSDVSKAEALDNTAQVAINTALVGSGNVVAAVTLDKNIIGAAFTGNTRIATFNLGSETANFFGTAAIGNAQFYDGNLVSQVNALASGNQILADVGGLSNAGTASFDSSSLSVSRNAVSSAATGNALTGTIVLADALAYNAAGANTSLADVGGVGVDVAATGGLVIASTQRNTDTVSTALSAVTENTLVNAYVQQADGSTFDVLTNPVTASAQGNLLSTGINNGAGSAAFDSPVTLASFQQADRFAVIGSVTGTTITATVGDITGSPGAGAGTVVGSDVAVSGNIVAANAVGNTARQKVALDATTLTLTSGGASLRIDGAPALATEAVIAADGAVTVSSVQTNATGSAVAANATSTRIQLVSNDDNEVSAGSAFAVANNIQQAFAVGGDAGNSLSLAGVSVGAAAGIANSQENASAGTVTATLTGSATLLVTDSAGSNAVSPPSLTLSGNRSEALATGVTAANALSVEATTIGLTGATSAGAQTLDPSLDTGSLAASYGVLNQQLVSAAVAASATPLSTSAAFAVTVGEDTFGAAVVNDANRLTAQAQAAVATNSIGLDIGTIAVAGVVGSEANSVASVLNVQQVAAAVTATAAPNGTAVVLTTLGNATGDNVDNASVSTSTNRITAIADGAVASNSLTVSGTSLAVFDGVGGTDGLSTVTNTSGILTTDAAFTLMNRQVSNTAGPVTATLRDGTTGSASVLTDIAGVVTGSSIVSNGNLLTALASSLESSNSLVIDGTVLRTTGALLNSQDSIAVVDALIGRGGATNVGGVTVDVDGNVSGSNVSVASNSVTGQAIGNTGSNSLSVSATSLDADGATVLAAAGVQGTAYGADADFALASDQVVNAGSASNAAVFTTFAIDQAPDQVISNSTLAVDGNAQVAEAMANTVTNTLSVSATDMDVTGDTSASLANRQGGTANVDASSDMELFANVQSSGSTITLDGNSNRAIGVVSNAANSLTVSGTNIAGTGANATATFTAGDTLAQGSFVLNNSQTTLAGSDLDTAATTTIYNNDAVDLASTGIVNGSVSMANNLTFAESSANRASNSVTVAGGASNAAPAALANDQSSLAAVNATATSSVRTTLFGTAAGPLEAAYSSSVSIAGNTTQALARGNTTTNTMVLNAGADFGTATTGANINSTPGASAGAATVLNAQSNAGAVGALATASYQVALNGETGAGDAAALNSRVSVSGNTVAAAAFGNQAINRIELAALNTGSATAAFNNVQTNSAPITATATSVNFAIGFTGTVTNGAASNNGNATSATAVGNSSITSIIGR